MGARGVARNAGGYEGAGRGVTGMGNGMGLICIGGGGGGGGG